MIKKEDIFPIGKFQRTHALKGELNMLCEIDPEYFIEGNPLIIEEDGILVPYFVESIRPKGSTSFLTKLEGINSEEEASLFVNKEIHILKKDAEEWLDDTLETWADFIEYKIIDDTTDKIIGSIKGVDDSTVNILFIIENEEGDEIYLPANEDLISEIDEERKEIRMILPDGIMELNNKKNEDI